MGANGILVIIAVFCEAGATVAGFMNKDPAWRGLLAIGLVFYMIAMALPK